MPARAGAALLASSRALKGHFLHLLEIPDTTLILAVLPSRTFPQFLKKNHAKNPD
jgi:hypothetical protein